MILFSQSTAKRALFCTTRSLSTAFIPNFGLPNGCLLSQRKQQHSTSATYQQRHLHSLHSHEKTSTDVEGQDDAKKAQEKESPQPTYLSEGLLAVYKPLEWTSQDVVAYIRGMLTRDARERGVIGNKRDKGRRKKPLKVGHGGTLDPLATGVLVIGVGKGTKKLQEYLSGNKKYVAGVELGFETETLDLEGNITRTASYDHVTKQSIEATIPQFIGNITQVPPIYSAIKRDGRKLYDIAREGASEEDIDIPTRDVFVQSIDLLETNDKGEGMPKHFGISVECGGGTYIRSLVRDIGTSLDTVATMTSLVRTQQGPFTLENALPREDWTVENIYEALRQHIDEPN